MTATVTNLDAGLCGKLQRALEQRVEDGLLPPAAGIKYTAGGVYAEYPSRLVAALVIVHPDEAGQPVVDGVLADMDEDGARAVVRHYYGIDLNAHRYSIEPLELDASSPLSGNPLAQAFNTAVWLLQQPPPPSRLEQRSWRHGLIYERAQEIANILVSKWSGCWGGEAVERLSRAALGHLEDNNLDAAEWCCEKAEAEMVRGAVDITARPRRRRKARK